MNENPVVEIQSFLADFKMDSIPSNDCHIKEGAFPLLRGSMLALWPPGAPFTNMV